MKRAGAMLILLTVGGCGEPSYETRERALVDFMADTSLGDGSDFWLVKTSAIGGPVRVGLVFGYADDFQACDELAEMANARYPAADYQCMSAN